MIKAIPTKYREIEFRSRLEADYAATFDRLGIAWEYEPEGYQLSDGTWYSPDFWLPSSKAWAEVKGDHGLGVSKVEQFAADLWEATSADNTMSKGAPLVVLLTKNKVSSGPVDPRDTVDSVEREMFDNTIRSLGVMGVGKYYSVILAGCPSCWTPSFIVLWQSFCSSCGVALEDPVLDWAWSDYPYFAAKVSRLPRPAGRRSR